MTRILIAADDVLEVEPGGHLAVPPGALITPLAADVAKERNVTLSDLAPATDHAEAGNSGDPLEQRIRSLVATMLHPGEVRGKHPVKLARARDVILEPFGQPGPGPDQ